MPRYKLTVEYEGEGFCGWQKQINGVSVQEALECAVHKFTGKSVNFVAAGRTDSGVHALGQVVHFDIDKELADKAIVGAINYHVKPAKITVVKAEKTEPGFHARFSCKSRSYIYMIFNRDTPSALFNNRMWHIRYNLDIAAMNEAAKFLLGKQDLSSFRSSKCQALSPIRTIDCLTVKEKPHNVVEIYISAPSFMHNQVRIITGCLVKIGLGEWDIDHMRQVIDAKSRIFAANTAPAHGLYFLEATY